MNPDSSQDDANITENKVAINDGKWSAEEHKIFLAAIKKYGDDWKLVAQQVGTRAPTQVRSHAQKFYNKQLNDSEKIGKNKAVIIGQESDGTSTRSKFRPRQPTSYKDSPSYPSRHQKTEKETPIPEKKKNIKKQNNEKKSKIASGIRASKTTIDTIMECEEESEELKIIIPTFTWVRPRREEGDSANTRGSSSYFMSTIVPKLNERGFDLRGQTLSLYELIEGVFKQ